MLRTGPEEMASTSRKVHGTAEEVSEAEVRAQKERQEAQALEKKKRMEAEARAQKERQEAEAQEGKPMSLADNVGAR